MERAQPRLESPADLDALLRNVEGLEAHIEEASLRAERAQRLDADTLGLLKYAGLFRMTMPADWDGQDLSLAVQADVVERLAALDGAIAWAVVAGSGAGLTLRNVPRSICFLIRTWRSAAP